MSFRPAATGLFLSLLVIGWLAGCAGKKTYVSPRAQLRLDRRDIVELNEAFKTAVEKTITLDVGGEIECFERACVYPVKGTAKVLKDGKDAGTDTIRGNLTFTREGTAKLLELMDHARSHAKEQVARGKIGEAICTSRGCTLDFALEERAGRRDVPVTSVISAP